MKCDRTSHVNNKGSILHKSSGSFVFFLLNLQLNTFKKQLLKRGPSINRFTLYEDDDKKKWRERHGCDESGKKGGSISLSTFEEENGHLPQVEVDEMPETRRKLL